MGDLLQSEGWERFQRALGRRTHRVDSAFAIEMSLPFGLSYWYAPRTGESRIMNQELWNRTCTALRKTGAIFLRIEHDSQPEIPDSPPKADPPREDGFQIPRMLRHSLEPEWTWRTSLEGSDDERMAAMHEKHRYNVRLAQRRGVTVCVSPPPYTPPPGEGGKEKGFLPIHRSGGGATRPAKLQRSGRGGGRDFEQFWILLHETAMRQKISPHSRRYYETMVRELPRTAVYFAEHEGTAIACAIIAYHGDTATYLHGGSSHAHRALMAPHLLHWQAMRDARDAGMHWYDWGGVSPPRAGISNFKFQISNSDWSGITRFKRGFGGEAIHHAPMCDLVFRPGWYRMLAWLARLRG